MTVVFLQRNSSSLSLYFFPFSDAIVLKQHSALQFSWLLKMCSMGTLLASLYSSIVFLYSFLSCTPNRFWAGGHLLWCTCITDPYFRWRWRICVLQLPSRDGRDLKGRMDLGFTHQVLLWMNSEIDLRQLWMDAWAQLALFCHRLWRWNQW